MTSTPSLYSDIRYDLVVPNPDQPRKHFDVEQLTELAGSVERLGILEPVIVRPVDDHFVIIAGERRWRAAGIAGLSLIPCRILEIGEVDAYVLSVAENVNRHDMTAIEEAAAYDQLVRYGKTVDEVAELFGKRPQDVQGRLTLLALEPHILQMVEAGQMGVELGRCIAQLKPGNQRVVAQRFARGEVDHTEAIAFARALLEAEAEVSFFDIEEPTEETRLVHAKAARQAQSLMQQIERLSGLLGDLSAMDPATLAEVLGNDVGARLASIERIGRQTTSAIGTLRKAKAVAEARTLAIR